MSLSVLGGSVFRSVAWLVLPHCHTHATTSGGCGRRARRGGGRSDHPIERDDEVQGDEAKLPDLQIASCVEHSGDGSPASLPLATCLEGLVVTLNQGAFECLPVRGLDPLFLLWGSSNSL